MKMSENYNNCMEHKIGKITYIVSAAYKQDTTKTVDDGITKLIQRDLITQKISA